MPPSAKPTAPLVLVCGEDEFAVKQRAKEVYLPVDGGSGRHGPRDH